MAPFRDREVYNSDSGLIVSERDRQMCLGALLDVYRFIIRLPLPPGTSKTQPRLPPTYDPHTRVSSLFETVSMGEGYLYNPSWDWWTRPPPPPPSSSSAAASAPEYTDAWDIWRDVKYDITKVEVHTGYRGAGPWMLKYRKEPQPIAHAHGKQRSTTSLSSSIPSRKASLTPISGQRNKASEMSKTLTSTAAMSAPAVRRSTSSPAPKKGIKESATGVARQKKWNWKGGRFWKK